MSQLIFPRDYPFFPQAIDSLFYIIQVEPDDQSSDGVPDLVGCGHPSTQGASARGVGQHRAHRRRTDRSESMALQALRPAADHLVVSLSGWILYAR